MTKKLNKVFLIRLYLDLVGTHTKTTADDDSGPDG